ncbi:methyltransferase domain-containing protein [Streptosporangium lutulentum]|uniref:2-polyprenyl-3-methyl-5-hydroxy-6-metoxy-1, 4-benzoquinol methylase n=1 Tax=Streptosporangium lutulentum TaxID=1461250 RepID=A0ABT9QVV9_9ACTN|nr:methyltransferase domain-containing protein [Streptosporangium lutulentum]MDP9850443.1 2-polyprenyl-3-methyl-5-hydroxy-6-metoxy-1,4-benzoquinol methylase [Streptosporangium lutulentum]
MTNTWTSTSDDLPDRYTRHAGTLRGALRHELVARALRTHLLADAQRILDVGGGDGHQAVQLARAGYVVTLLDPDIKMLQHAETRLAAEANDVRQRVTMVHGPGEQACDLVGTGFDAVCCHGVLMYLADPQPLLKAMVSVVRPGGLVSLLAKSANALAMRPGLKGQWAEALTAMTTTTETGNLGVPSRAHTLEELRALLTAAGATTTVWYGVRIFADHRGDEPIPGNFDQIVELEWYGGSRDPYRQVARLLHLIAHREPQQDAQ